MRIVFFGTPEIALPSLQAVAAAHELVALVCRPDRAKGRSKKLVPPPTKQWALDNGIEVNQPEKLNDGSFEAWLSERAPECCTLVAYGRILKQAILDIPSQGFLNVHTSLLPRHRGPSPIQTALLEGDTETGVTVMGINADMDGGDILLQQTVPIAEDDTTGSLSEKLGEVGASALLKGIEQLENGDARFTPQDDSQATYCKLFKKEDGRIVWGSSADQIRNLVRAAHPWPVAHCLLDGKIVRIHAATSSEESTDEVPGTILSSDAAGLLVATGHGALSILTIQAPGKRPMPVTDYLRGNPMTAGQTFKDL